MGSSSLFVSGAMIWASGAALRIDLKIARIIAMMDSSFAVLSGRFIFIAIYLLVSIPMDGDFVVAGVMVVAIC